MMVYKTNGKEFSVILPSEDSSRGSASTHQIFKIKIAFLNGVPFQEPSSREDDDAAKTGDGCPGRGHHPEGNDGIYRPCRRSDTGSPALPPFGRKEIPIDIFENETRPLLCLPNGASNNPSYQRL